MPGPGYIGQFGNPWTSMGGIMAVRQQIHDQQMDQNKDVRAKTESAAGVGLTQAQTGLTKASTYLKGIEIYNSLIGGLGGGGV